MRHYEIILLVHPDQSEQLPAMTERYRTIIEADGGKIHRFEDWGRRQLAYPIQKIYKAHYLLMNIECNQAAMDELESLFRFNDAILRDMVIRCNEAITEPSPLARQRDEEQGDSSDRSRGRRAPASDTNKESSDEAAPEKDEAEADSDAESEAKENADAERVDSESDSDSDSEEE